MEHHDSLQTQESQKSKSSYTVLYIEDDEANRQLVEFIMARRTDLTLILAENGYNGIEKAVKHTPNVILLDLSLPDIDGFTVLKKLLEDEKTKEIPVIAISGNSAPMDIDTGLKAGFKGYLAKPVNIEKLYTAIDANLSPVKGK